MSEKNYMLFRTWEPITQVYFHDNYILIPKVRFIILKIVQKRYSTDLVYPTKKQRFSMEICQMD